MYYTKYDRALSKRTYSNNDGLILSSFIDSILTLKVLRHNE